MKRIKYINKFNSIIADLVLDKVKGKITEYDYHHIKSYLIDLHNVLNLHGKRKVFYFMNLVVEQNKLSLSKYEVYAYKLVAEKFHRRELVEICE